MSHRVGNWEWYVYLKLLGKVEISEINYLKHLVWLEIAIVLIRIAFNLSVTNCIYVHALFFNLNVIKLNYVQVLFFKLNVIKLIYVLMFNSHYFHSDFGFHVYIDEMNLDTGDDATNVDWKCRDYLQFGRDVFLLTTFRSQDYCGIRTRIQVTRSRRGVSSKLLKIPSNVQYKASSWIIIILRYIKIKNQINFFLNDDFKNVAIFQY